MESAHDVAKHIISFSHEHGDPVTNLKLQKLLYYAQAWHLALHDEPLFGERLEAWVHGPVVPPVYGKYKAYWWSPIDVDTAPPSFSENTSAHLDEVMGVYGGLTAYYLERLTHQELPWIKARKGLPPDEASTEVIEHEDMKFFYQSQLNDEATDSSSK